MFVLYKAEHLNANLKIPLDGLVAIHLIGIINRYNRFIYIHRGTKLLKPDLESLTLLVELEKQNPQIISGLSQVGVKMLASWKTFKTIYFTEQVETIIPDSNESNN